VDQGYESSEKESADMRRWIEEPATNLAWKMTWTDEAILLRGAIDLGVFLKRLKRIRGATQCVCHLGTAKDEKNEGKSIRDTMDALYKPEEARMEFGGESFNSDGWLLSRFHSSRG
jgi:hypothetical protein